MHCKENTMNRIRNSMLIVAAVATLGAGVVPSQATNNRYHQENLVSDVPGMANKLDAHLVNPWGVAFNPFNPGFVWVADNGTGLSTLYDGDGNPQSLVVAIPSLPPSPEHGLPTGIVFSGSSDFTFTNPAATPPPPAQPARFIFATQDGLLAAWSPVIDLTHALIVATVPDASYFGLALAADSTGNFLYAANFRSGKIDKFDKNFQLVPQTGFVDPSLPADFAPFNIQNILGDLYVAYAKREILPSGEAEEVPGPGLGFVNVFDARGNLIRRVASRGKLNAPWGLAMAPASFGKHAGQLLVGNFGDGTINAYDASTGAFKGKLRGTNNKPLQNDGLWGMAFGNGLVNQPTGTLFFAAGIQDEEHGLYGAITPTAGGSENEPDED
jgi:uncharacterized protein (TIGR03118 family)